MGGDNEKVYPIFISFLGTYEGTSSHYFFNVQILLTNLTLSKQINSHLT